LVWIQIHGRTVSENHKSRSPFSEVEFSRRFSFGTILAVERTIFQVRRRERRNPAITIKLGKICVLRLIGIRNPEQL
jgi:hypothetical protein